MQPSNTGVLLDNRDEFEKSKDHLHEEIAMGFTPHVWEERPAKPRYYFAYSQSSSLSCMAGGGAIIIDFFDGDIISRKDIYNPRVNYPGGGMILYDLLSIIRRGACTEDLVPSQNLGESKMNDRYPITQAIIKSRSKKRVGQTFIIENRDIDTIASIISTSPVIALWYFDENGDEWWNPYPKVKYDFKSYVDKGVTRHQVVIVDAILIDGKKYLVGQDTAGIGTGAGQDSNLRYISEDMVNKRLYSAGYAVDDDSDIIKPEPIIKPVYANLKPLQVNSKGKEVEMLQSVLIYEGILKIKAPTGVFGGLTRKAVIALQEKYTTEILKPAGLKKGTGYVGTLTNVFLNKKYSM